MTETVPNGYRCKSCNNLRRIAARKVGNARICVTCDEGRQRALRAIKKRKLRNSA